MIPETIHKQEKATDYDNLKFIVKLLWKVNTSLDKNNMEYIISV